jgi:uncharacterized DUF497 family protein
MTTGAVAALPPSTSITLLASPASVAFAPDRVVTLAMSPRERILYVVSTERGSRVRLNSARRASVHERPLYEDDP